MCVFKYTYTKIAKTYYTESKKINTVERHEEKD